MQTGSKLSSTKARFNLGKVKNVINQLKQVLATSVNRLDVIDLASSHTAGGKLQQQVEKAQNAVERRPQFVGDRRQKLGLPYGNAKGVQLGRPF
jgi:hypothetical protein